MKSTSLSPPQIVEQYGPLVSSIAHRMNLNRVSVEDATQEAWLEILRSLPTFEGRSSLSTWIYTIASRTVLHLSLPIQRFQNLRIPLEDEGFCDHLRGFSLLPRQAAADGEDEFTGLDHPF